MSRLARVLALIGLAGLAFVGRGVSAAQPASVLPLISQAVQDNSGFLVHTVVSEYQSGETSLKVLVPDRLQSGKQYRALYVLPVEAGDTAVWGQALEEVKRLDLHNKHQLICVYPTFSHLPWYADHPSDPKIRQESHFLRVVVPAIERTYPVRAARDGRLLVGFSKSGWGAFSILLRNPELFDRAVAWDAPLTVDRPVPFGMGGIFGDQANFEKYQITRLLAERADLLIATSQANQRPRLAVLGYDNFRQHHVAIHQQMEDLKIPHVYRDGPKRKHHWQSGWLAEAVEIVAER